MCLSRSWGSLTQSHEDARSAFEYASKAYIMTLTRMLIIDSCANEFASDRIIGFAPSIRCQISEAGSAVRAPRLPRLEILGGVKESEGSLAQVATDCRQPAPDRSRADVLDFTIAFASLSFFNIWTYTLTRAWYLSIYAIVASWSVCCLGLIVLDFSTFGRLANMHDWLFSVI